MRAQTQACAAHIYARAHTHSQTFGQADTQTKITQKTDDADRQKEAELLTRQASEASKYSAGLDDDYSGGDGDNSDCAGATTGGVGLSAPPRPRASLAKIIAPSRANGLANGDMHCPPKLSNGDSKVTLRKRMATTP